jgi:hypothetical protein
LTREEREKKGQQEAGGQQQGEEQKKEGGAGLEVGAEQQKEVEKGVVSLTSQGQTMGSNRASDSGVAGGAGVVGGVGSVSSGAGVVGGVGSVSSGGGVGGADVAGVIGTPKASSEVEERVRELMVLLEGSQGEVEKLGAERQQQDVALQTYRNSMEELELAVRQKEETVTVLRERVAGEESRNKNITASLKKAKEALDQTEQEKGEMEHEQQRLKGRIAGPIAGALKEWERSAATRFLRAPYAASPVPQGKSVCTCTHTHRNTRTRTHTHTHTHTRTHTHTYTHTRTHTHTHTHTQVARGGSKALNSQHKRPAQTNINAVSPGVQAVIGKRPLSLVTSLWAGQKAHTWLVCYCCGKTTETLILHH